MILYDLIILPIEMLVEITYGIMDKIFANCGVSIIGVSLVVQTLILPLYKRADAIQDEERVRQSEMSHWISHIKKTFKGDERFMMLSTYYREQNYKSWYPLKSSVSILLQIPFFIAAYHYLSNLSALSGQSFLFIKDLGAPDSIAVIGGFTINILPILMTGFNLISGMVYTKGLALRDKVQVYGLAAIFLVLLYNSPSGLVLYWTMNNLYSMMKNIVMKILAKKVHLKKAGFTTLHRIIADGYQRTVAESVNPLRIYLLSALFLTVFIGGVISLNVVSASPAEFVADGYGPAQIVINNIAVYAGIFLVWGTIFVAMMKPAAQFFTSAIFFAGAVIATVDYLAFATDIGTMSTVLIYDTVLSFSKMETIVNAVIAAALFVLSMWIAFRHVRVEKRIIQALSIGALAMAAVTVSTLHTELNEITAKKNNSTYDGEEIIHLSKSGKNVVVLMLDRAIGGYVPFIFDEKPEIAEAFDGFTYYPNTLSFGAHTNLATPSLFGGYEYSPVEINKRSDESLRDKHDEALLVMPKLFSDEGYDVSVISPPYAGYMWDPDLSIYDGMENVSAYDPVGWFTEQALTSYGADYRKLQQLNFAYYSMMKISPVLLQTHIYREGAYWTQVKSAIDTDFLDSYTTLTHLTELTEIEDDDTDNLLLMQNGTTHDVVLLKTPEYVPDDEVSTIEALIGDVDPQIVTVDGVSMELTNTEQDSHYMCNVASYKELADWFDYIRANDCWDNTRIIIVSDHGYDMGQFDYMELSNGIDVEFYNALLLVKDFGAAEYTVSAEFMTIADVPSLAVSGLFEDAVNPYTGNIISSDAKESAVYVTTSNNFKISEDQGNIFDTSDGEWYTVKDNIFDVNNWIKVEEP